MPLTGKCQMPLLTYHDRLRQCLSSLHCELSDRYFIAYRLGVGLTLIFFFSNKVLMFLVLFMHIHGVKFNINEQ